jgi:phosphatidylserine/phosphatidylglycerophosphate/cardiolipin synthase-like enzyme/MFS family permease
MQNPRGIPNSLREFTSRSYFRNLLVAALGFAAAGALGLILAVILLKSPLTAGLVGLVDASQPLQRLVLALVLFLIGMAISGVVIGSLGGWVLTVVDPLALRRRYVWTGAVAFAVPQTILVPLALILASLLGIYYNNIDVNPAHLPVLFGIFGLFYGMLAGVIFGLSSVGFKYGWGVLFAAMMGGALGGVITGGLLRLVMARMGISELAQHWWLALLIFMVFYGSLGLALGVVYTWFHRARRQGGDLPGSMGRYWRIFAIFAVAMVLLNLAGVFYQVFTFAMMKPASTSTVISPETKGVAWTGPQPLPDASGAAENPSLAANVLGDLGLAWSRFDADGEKSVSLSQGQVNARGLAQWERTHSLDNRLSRNPAIAGDRAGNWHVVWESLDQTGTQVKGILYQRCNGDACDSPVELTALPSDCSHQDAPSSPTIAIDNAGRIMTVWATDDALAYLSWRAGDPPPRQVDCLPIQGGNPRLAPRGNDGFLLSWEREGSVYLTHFRDGGWYLPALFQAPGRNATPLFDAERAEAHLAWCGEDRQPHHFASASGEEKLAGPGCVGRVILRKDDGGRRHLLWESTQAVNPFGFVHSGHFLYDSIRQDDGWSQPALIHIATGPDPFDVTADAMGGLQITGMEAGGWFASRPRYDCPDTTGSPYGDAILNVLKNDPYRPAGAPIPFCGNQFLGLYMLPYTPAGDGVAETTPDSAFDEVADQIHSARYEVLFATMEWMKDENMDSPGFLLAQAVSDLYDEVKAHPENYPRGMTVRILLGNYPELATFTWGDQVWNVMDVLQKAGLPEMENPELGWKVELANFDGQNPHSHAKFLIIDGEKVMAAGFNYSYLHYSRNHPSGLGVSLVDYGMLMRGPVAQDALASYDDLWAGSTLIECPGLTPPKGDWARYCTEAEDAAAATHVPEVTLYHPAPEDDIAFSLLRTSNRPESDKALEALLNASQEHIDIFEVNFSLEVYCALGIVMDDFCSMNDALPYMQALLDVMERNQVHIRVLTTDVNMNGIENSVAIETFRKELARRGLSDLAEFRYYAGRMHAKAFLVDDQFMVVGSQDFHYSAWGDDRGLVEYNLATDSPAAIRDFQGAFKYYWERGKPVVSKKVRSE